MFKIVDLERLGRRMCHALRHAPEQYGLTLTREGYVSVAQLARAMKVSTETIGMAADADEKGRYQIERNQIRAIQGHSTSQVNRSFITSTPPDILYHGTAARFVDSIMEDGQINAGKRQFVHLSADVDTAADVGRRHGQAVILEIRALDLHRSGHPFMLAENGVWLTPFVPTIYVTTLWGLE